MLVATVINATVAGTGISKADLLGPSRVRVIARPRQVGMFLSWRLITDITKSRIARAWGGRDHTTIDHGLRLVERLLSEDDPVCVSLVKAILDQLDIEQLSAARQPLIARRITVEQIAATERELSRLQACLRSIDAGQPIGAVQ